MNSDLFTLIEMKCLRFQREALELQSKFELLGSFHTFPTRPEGSVRHAARRLREAADYLDELADKAAKARQPFKEAAE